LGLPCSPARLLESHPCTGVATALSAPRATMTGAMVDGGVDPSSSESVTGRGCPCRGPRQCPQLAAAVQPKVREHRPLLDSGRQATKTAQQPGQRRYGRPCVSPHMRERISCCLSMRAQYGPGGGGGGTAPGGSGGHVVRRSRSTSVRSRRCGRVRINASLDTVDQSVPRHPSGRRAGRCSARPAKVTHHRCEHAASRHALHVRPCRGGDDRRLQPGRWQRASAIAEHSSTLADPSSTAHLQELVVQRVGELSGTPPPCGSATTRAASSCAPPRTGPGPAGVRRAGVAGRLPSNTQGSSPTSGEPGRRCGSAGRAHHWLR
jgi:hypothetical protein